MKFLHILLLTAVSSTPAEPDILPDVLRFEKTWTPFLFKLAGCSIKRTSEKQCDPARAEFDYALFLKSRKAAATLFALKEP